MSPGPLPGTRGPTQRQTPPSREWLLMMDYLFGSLDVETLQQAALAEQGWDTNYTEALLDKVREIFTRLDPT